MTISFLAPFAGAHEGCHRAKSYAAIKPFTRKEGDGKKTDKTIQRPAQLHIIPGLMWFLAEAACSVSVPFPGMAPTLAANSYPEDGGIMWSVPTDDRAENLQSWGLLGGAREPTPHNSQLHIIAVMWSST
jgi:hypothetical protein